MNENQETINTNPQVKETLFSKVKARYESNFKLIDLKLSKLIPDVKLRKILYITISAFSGIIILIIILGILTMPLRQTANNSNFTLLNKPKVINSTPLPEKQLSETEQKLLNLENSVKDLRFPESILNIPVIERGIEI